MDYDKEAVLSELTAFEKKLPENNEIPEILEKYLISVAKSGETEYPWTKVKPLIKHKMELVIEEFKEKYPPSNVPDLPNCKTFDFQEMKKEVLDCFDIFYGPPFTIQRICELLIEPYKHYKRTDKFMRGLEKNVLVVSTIEPNSSSKVDQQNHKGLFSSGASSSSAYQSPSSSYVNGIVESLSSPSISTLQSDYSPVSRVSSMSSPSSPSSPAPLQQLDSFTTVFASPPSTPLAVVSDMSSYDAASSPSSSSSSSSDSSPQHPSSSSPPCASVDNVTDGTSLKFNGDSKDINTYQELQFTHASFESISATHHTLAVSEDLKISEIPEQSGVSCQDSTDSCESSSSQDTYGDCSETPMESPQDCENLADLPHEQEPPHHLNDSITVSEKCDLTQSNQVEGEEKNSAPMELDDDKPGEENKPSSSDAKNEKLASEEVRLVTEHLKEAVSSTPSEDTPAAALIEQEPESSGIPHCEEN